MKYKISGGKWIPRWRAVEGIANPPGSGRWMRQIAIKPIRPAIIVLSFLAFGGVVILIATCASRTVDGWGKFMPMSAELGASEDAIKQILLGSEPAGQRYEALSRYFIVGFLQHSTALHERIHYRGAGGIAGFQVNGLEGFARTAPLLAAWVGSDRHESLDLDGQRVDLVDVLRSGILQGTDPKSPYYWGDIGHFDQRIAEAADIARTLYLTRSQLWDRLPSDQREQVSAWLRQVNSKETVRNNWLLFSVVVNAILANLGGETFTGGAGYGEFKTHYLESGWFFDDVGVVDFYNAWGISYDLFWIHLVQPAFDDRFLERVLAESAELTGHLISPKGIPIMGRSMCYRTAIPSPVVARTFLTKDPYIQGLGLRALDVTWRYFVAGNSLRDGGLTQGYLDTDLRFLDRYSGAGSCHWGLRSLTLAMMHFRGDDFWRTSASPLPVEQESFSMVLEKLKWKIVGDKNSGEILITVIDNPSAEIAIQPYSKLRQWTEYVLRRPARPNNHAIEYGARQYSALHPFSLDGTYQGEAAR